MCVCEMYAVEYVPQLTLFQPVDGFAEDKDGTKQSSADASQRPRHLQQ